MQIISTMADELQDICDERILSNGVLPGDVIVSILLKLPVKSLLKFKSVCKSWLSFINSSRFKKIHLLHRQSVTPDELILLRGCDFNKVVLFTCNLNANRYGVADVLLPTSPLSSPCDEDCHNNHTVVLDSCNGLVCLASLQCGESGAIILWNLASRKCRFLELPLEHRPTFIYAGLGYIAAMGDFKIVAATYTFPGNIMFSVPKLDEFVYTLSSDSWKKLDHDSSRSILQPSRPIFLNGCMNYLVITNLRRYIVAFDVADEVSSHFALPDNCGIFSEFTVKLVVIRDLLSVLNFHESKVMESGIEIWVMTEYGVEGSWDKQFIIEGLTTVVRPIGSWKDGELLFAHKELDSEILMTYDPFTKKKKYYPEIKSTYLETLNFVESLATVEGGR